FLQFMGENPAGNNSLRSAADTEIIDKGVHDIHADLVWGTVDYGHNVTTNIAGQGVKVCVLDTGIDSDHPDLKDNFVSGISFCTDDQMNDVEDSDGHGTECAGLICAEDNAEGVIGVAPEAELYVGKVFNNNSFNDPDTALLNALNYYSTETSNGGGGVMDIISLSLGDSHNVYGSAIKQCFDKGIVLVAASGNGGSDGIGDPQLLYPASSPYTISVGSVNLDTYGNWVKSDFSNYGNGLDLVAPGRDLYSTTLNDSYKGGLTGTSFAAPLVSGVCALLLSKASNESFHLTNKEIKWILCNTTDKVGGGYNTNGWSEYYGYGMVNAKRAVDNCRPPKITIESPTGGTIAGSTTITASVTDDGTHTVRCRIDNGAWHDMTSIGNGKYQGTLDVTNQLNGIHNVECRVIDGAGFSASDIVSVTVNNNLNIQITSLIHNIPVSGTVDIYADVKVNGAVYNGACTVQCEIGSRGWENMAFVGNGEYLTVWDTTQESNEGIPVSCKFTLLPGEYVIDTVGVTVDNPPSGGGGGSGGGGCPYLSVYNGSEYVSEGLLNIHNLDGYDVHSLHLLQTTPSSQDHRYLLRLTEHPKTISHIDQVKLYGMTANGTFIQLPLLSAIHSSLGDVKFLLQHSDDRKVTELGANYNNGVSESIDLEFLAIPGLKFVSFVFYIEGVNQLIK
ncbi:MAG: S8 family serine peptidase, partial [Candidatus Lokiarchaeota archaeon]